VATEFEAARLYLARWARVVAEEGERSRRDELAARAGRGDASAEDVTSLGVFSLLPGNRKMPKPTRHPEHPITAEDWDDFIATGKDELLVRQEIFRRGFSDLPNDQGARRRGWEVLLGVVPWSVEEGPSGLDRLSQRAERRDKVLRGRREEYERLHQGWREKTKNGEAEDSWKEEWHRIDVSSMNSKELTTGRLPPDGPHSAIVRSYARDSCRRRRGEGGRWRWRRHLVSGRQGGGGRTRPSEP
jgi:hypothetical protein